MGSTPIPPSLDQLAGRTFAFYPALLGVAHNEWRFEKATWSEILVTNTQTGSEVWIPRRFVGEVSRTDDPILIVGLNRELELKSGMVVDHQRRVFADTPHTRRKPGCGVASDALVSRTKSPGESQVDSMRWSRGRSKQDPMRKQTMSIEYLTL